jgi:RHS repeat-associated protein
MSFPRFLYVLIALAILAWSDTRCLGHGPQPGSWSPPIEPGRDLAESLAWQGRCLDPTGFYNLGARHLEKDHGIFLSYDPIWNIGSMDGYSYPADSQNIYDPDGRLAKGGFSAGRDLVVGVAGLGLNIGGTFAYGVASGTDYFSGGNSAGDLYGQYRTGLTDVAYGIGALGYDLGNVTTGFDSDALGLSQGRLLGVGNQFTGGADRSFAYRFGYSFVNFGTVLLGGQSAVARAGTLDDVARFNLLDDAAQAAGRSLDDIAEPFFPGYQGGPGAMWIGEDLSKAKTATETFEIIEGVRRAKANQLLGNSTVPANIFNAEGKLVGQGNIAIDALRSPNKSVIDISTQAQLDRYMSIQRGLQQGANIPPISITPGTRGVPIQDIIFDANRGAR